MAPYDPDSLSALLERALALPSEARIPFLNEVCDGDEGLREELTSLLVAHEAESGFFERLSDEIVSPALFNIDSLKDSALEAWASSSRGSTSA